VALQYSLGELHTSLGGSGVVRQRNLSKIATPDFFAKAEQMDFTDIFKLALLRVATVMDGQMDSAKI